MLEKINPNKRINIPKGSLGLKILRSKAESRKIIIKKLFLIKLILISNLFLRIQRM